MTPFTITHSGGSRVVPIYTIPARSRSYAASSRFIRGSTIARVDGDLYEIPSGLQVRLFVDEVSLALAYDTAYAIIDEANDATQVEWYEGVQLVDGILSAEIQIENPHLFLVLTFAPTKGDLQP